MSTPAGTPIPIPIFAPVDRPVEEAAALTRITGYAWNVAVPLETIVPLILPVKGPTVFVWQLPSETVMRGRDSLILVVWL